MEDVIVPGFYGNESGYTGGGDFNFSLSTVFYLCTTLELIFDYI